MKNIIDKIKSIFDTIKSFRFRRWGEILVIPVVVFVLLRLVEDELLDRELGWKIVVVVLLVWGVVAGALIVFGTKEWKIVVGLQAVVCLLFFVVGIITKYMVLVHFFDIVIVEAIVLIVFGGFFFVLKTIKDDPKFIIFLISTIILWNVLRVVVKADLLDSMIVTMFVDILIDKIYQYYVECEEICLLRKLGENKFNKEYFDIYYNGKIIFYRVIYYVACISVVIYNVIYNNVDIRKVIDHFGEEYESDTKQIIIQYISKGSKGLKDFGVTFIIFIILMIIVRIVNYLVAINPKCGKEYFGSIKNINKLVKEKKNNFESYTQREESIILR